MPDRKINTQKTSLFDEALRYLVGGVNSPVRSFSYAGIRPLLAQKGQGSRIFDYRGNSYIDYVLSYGALILGHAHPVVSEGVKAAINDGFGFGLTHENEIKLAAAINKVIPFVEKIRFVNSGTEAVMGALRLARGFRQRKKIVKFTNSYHGHADYLLVKSGSGLASTGLAQGSGIPDDFIKHTITVDYADIRSLEEIFADYGNDIAAVIVEPVGGNFGVLAPDISFLQQLRAITRQHKALLVFDEIITGFRFCFGSFAGRLGIEPDLICLGKIIGGGLPIGAYGGSSGIMNNLAPLGDVYQASTFGGNPVVMAAGLATLEMLGLYKDRYEEIADFTKELTDGIQLAIRAYGIEAGVSRYGPMFSLRFRKKGVFSLFYKALLDKGVFFAPSEFEANFVAFVHSENDLQTTLAGVEDALKTTIAEIKA